MTLSELLNKGIVNQVVRTTGTKYQPIDREALQSLIDLVVTDATNFNSGKQKKRRIRLQDIETSLITDMSGLFKNFDFTVFINQKANDLTIIDKESLQDFIDDWDVSNVKDMSYMFAESVIFGQDLSKWTVSNVLDMSYMFNRSTFSGDISNWNIEKCMNFEMCINAGYTDDQSREILIKNKIYAHPLFINISGWLNSTNTYLLFQPVCVDNNGDNIRGVDYLSYQEKNYIQVNGSLDSLLHKHNSEITQVGVQSEIDCLYRNIINNNSEVSNYYLINKLIDATTKVGSTIDAYYNNIFLKNPEVGDHCIVYGESSYSSINAKFIHKSVFNFLPKSSPYSLYILKPENIAKVLQYYYSYEYCNMLKTSYNNDLCVENYRAISHYIYNDIELTSFYLSLMKPIIDSLTTEEINYLQNNSWSTLAKMMENLVDDTAVTAISKKLVCKIYLCLTAKEREAYCERIQKLHEISSNKTFADSPEFKELFCELLKDDSKLYTALNEFYNAMSTYTLYPDLYYFVVHPADQPFIFTANLSNDQKHIGELDEYDLNELLTAINSHNDTRISEIVEDALLPVSDARIMKNINQELDHCRYMEKWIKSEMLKVGMKYDTDTIYDAKLYDIDTKISYTCKVQLAFDDAITVKITEPDDNLTALDTEYYILNKNLYVSADSGHYRSDSNEYITTSTRLIKFAPRNSTKTKYMLIYLPVMNDA